MTSSVSLSVAKAAEVEEKLLAIEGLSDQHVEFLLDIPQIQIEVDLEKAQQVGLKPGDVRRSAAYMMAGEEAGDVHTQYAAYDVNVWSIPSSRHSLTSIYEMPIDTPLGEKRSRRFAGESSLALHMIVEGLRSG